MKYTNTLNKFLRKIFNYSTKDFQRNHERIKESQQYYNM